MKKLRKKGFTLIELMIVLAIIAILAVVLIPKAGLMKDNAKNAGVDTNVNTVRALLETKTADGTYYKAAGATKLVTALNVATTIPNRIVNPLLKGEAVLAFDVADTDLDPDTNSVAVVPQGANFTTLPTAPDQAILANRGSVVVYVYDNGFVVFGVDADGSFSNMQLIQ